MYNKIQNKSTLEIINKPFLNLLYFHFNFFKYFVNTMATELDKGESIFSRDHYNYVKTKDGKYIAMGNLEPKFQDNMKSVLDTLGNGNANSNDYRSSYDEEDPKKNHHDYDTISNTFSNHNRDELFVKVKLQYSNL
jgi:hypothetical protein